MTAIQGTLDGKVVRLKASRARARILIVEDEAVVALALEQIVTELGYEVAGIAATADAAVRGANELRPDLVVLDIRLANASSGIEAARRIRAELHIPHLFMTASADPQTLAQAMATKPRGFIAKPYSTGRVRTALEQAFDSFRQQRLVPAR